MTHKYSLTGMTCAACEAKVKSTLLSTPHILSAEVSRKHATAIIEMEKHISLPDLQKALGGTDSKYQIAATDHNETAEQARDWLITYKPVLLIFAYLFTATIAIEWLRGFSISHWMNNFMAGFFLVFSFFKLLNLSAFAESYSMYDVVAKRWKAWGYIYAFIELTLGILFLIQWQPLFTNMMAFIVMAVSIVGVLQSVFNKRKIKCACLGAVFNLPMSTITIIEDALMMAMSGIMVVMFL